jgi:hypothetical protein
MPGILEVMVGDKIQGLLGLLKIFVEGPKGLGQVQFFGRWMLRCQFIEFSALLLVIFWTNP